MTEATEGITIDLLNHSMGVVQTLKPDSGMQGSPGCVTLPCCYQQSRHRRGLVSCKAKGEKLGQQGKRRKEERE